MDPFDALAISSSTPFRRRMSGEQMRTVFLTGVVPDGFEPHVERALAELPIEMLAQAADSLPSGDWPKVARNVARLAARWDAAGRLQRWLVANG